MPYKDPCSEKARQSQHERYRRWYEKNKELERQRSKTEYWHDPEKERQRNRVFKNTLDVEKRCVNCGKTRDRENKVLCSACAPIHAASVKKAHLKVKLAAFDAYGGAICSCCGETRFEFMSIDHIDGGGSEHRKQLRGGDGYSGGGGVRLYLWLKRNGYPSGYRVLCRNCNASFGENGYCPHERERLDGSRTTTRSSRTFEYGAAVCHQCIAILN
jgi:hypothetical protein